MCRVQHLILQDDVALVPKFCHKLQCNDYSYVIVDIRLQQVRGNSQHLAVLMITIYSFSCGICRSNFR